MPYIEDGQTIQWSIEKRETDKQGPTKQFTEN